MTSFAQSERSAVADLLLEFGPDQPTLCEGWTTRDLAAHLVVRATRPDAAAGVVIPAFAGHTDKVRRQAAAQDWSTLVAKVRKRPGWAVIGDEATNLAEYFVHLEDIRRAQPGWRPRELAPDLAAALWARTRFQAKLALRRTPAAVTVTAPGIGALTAGKGGPAVELSGPPGEVLLFLMGRQEHARVELTGPDEIVDRMRHAHYGV